MPLLRFQLARGACSRPAGTGLSRRFAADLEHAATRRAGREIVSVFFGGGTPSLFSARSIEALLRRRANFCRFAATRNHAGGQSRHDRARPLHRLRSGRREPGLAGRAELRRSQTRPCSAAFIPQVTSTARWPTSSAAGVDNFNLDLMYALPEQIVGRGAGDLARAVALWPTHISHYQLTLEPETPFAKRPPANLPDDDASFEMQQACQAYLAQRRLCTIRSLGLCQATASVASTTSGIGGLATIWASGRAPTAN